MRYWISAGDGKTRGPVTLERLQELRASGRLSARVVVCQAGDTTWIPLSEVLGDESARTYLPSPPVPPQLGRDSPWHSGYGAVGTNPDVPYSSTAVGNDDSAPLVLATPEQRLGALAIDFALTLTFMLLYFALRLAFSHLVPRDYRGMALILALFLALAGWSAMRAGGAKAHHQTFGKRALGLAVVRTDGSALTRNQRVHRGFAKLLSLVSVFGALMMLSDSDHRCLHDRMIGTKVVRRRTPAR